jgi:hypothetical protein
VELVIVGGLLALAGTIVGFVGNWIVAKTTTDAQRRRDHEARVATRRADAHVAMIRFTRRVRQIMEMTIPVLDAGGEPPPAPTEDDTDAMETGIATFGSAEVRDQLEKSRRLQNAFWAKAQHYRHERASGSSSPSDLFELHQQVEAIRKDYRDLYETMRAQVVQEIQEQ